MKWFMVTNGQSLQDDSFFRQLVVALRSSERTCVFTPYLLYDGDENERTEWLRSNGVEVIHHALSIRREIEKFIIAESDPGLIPVRTGAYLKTEIPTAVRDLGLTDKFVFYTDCDVVFCSKVDVESIRPRYMAAHGNYLSSRRVCGRRVPFLGGEFHFNSGVAVLNVDALCSEADRFRSFVLSNGDGVERPKRAFMQKNLFLSDQVALNLYFSGRVDHLPGCLNWSPQSGISSKAKIVHFNGLKWTQWDDFLSGSLAPFRMEKFQKQVARDRDAYEYYVGLAKQYDDGGVSSLVG